jgi:sec-independent protein translocase protein TatC
MKLFGSHTTTEAKLPPAGTSGDGALLEPSHNLAEMGFLDHLEELRWTLIKGMAGVLVTTIVCGFFAEWIIQNILLAPTQEDFFMYEVLRIPFTSFDLQNRSITGQFFAYWGTILGVGVVVGSPVFVFFLWKFIEPALYPNEKDGLRFAAAFATFFFILGICFGYGIITPIAIQFFAAFQISPEILNEFDISRYFSMVTFWAFGTGLLFKLPVVIYFLAKLGIATPDFLRQSRRYAVVITLVLGALFTPPDPLSQLLVALPLLGLYEMSIHIAAVVHRRREKALKKALE